MYKIRIFLPILFICTNILAHEELETIRVSEKHGGEVPLSAIHQESVVKKEILTRERIEHKNANTLARALDLEPGVQSTVSCATCGSQRVTLNGLRAENTTVLIDGIPAFSSVSSFYGMEAIPLVGIREVEVMRGAGASLTAPESIGGAVNLVTLSPDRNSFSYEVRAGENEYFNQQLLGTYGSSRGGVLISAQTNQLGFFDEDNNKVAESPRQLQHSLFLKQEGRLGDKFKFSGRVGYQYLELIGGATEHLRPADFPGQLADDADFPAGDVREKFNGDLSKITDWVRLKRLDGGGSLTYHLSDEVNLVASFSLAKQNQYSIYSHGYDYDNEDMFRFYDLKVNKVLGDAHFITIGLDHRNEEMNSASDFLYQVNGFKKDGFEFDTLGTYIQDEWFVSDRDEVNLVLRIDHMKVDWNDQSLKSSKIKKTAFAPRIHYKRIHSEELSSRFSVGVGYRAPLTLFESQHGTNDEGFELNITELEKAQTLTYTLNRDASNRSSAFSATLTHLENMAFADEEKEPLEFRSASDTFNIGTFNLLHVERVTPHWTLEGSFDWFILPDDYKQKLPVAAQETRARFVSDYHFGNSEFVTFLNVIGPRNLRPYGYERNYNILTEDPFTFEDVPSSRKNQNAPLYFTIDLFFSHHFNKKLDWLLGVTNLFDFTQSDADNTPLAWRTHGEHAHLDNRHIWGPNQGRIIYTGIKFQL